MKYLIDSNIIIYHLNGNKIATDFICDNFDQVAISRITFIEVLSYDYSTEEQSEIIDFLSSFEIHDTNNEIAMKCLKNRKQKKIKIPDNIIAATAQTNNLILVTRNTADFESLNLETLDIFKC